MSLKEEMITKMETALESYRRKFAVMRHQQGLVYSEYVTGQKVEDRPRVFEYLNCLGNFGAAPKGTSIKELNLHLLQTASSTLNTSPDKRSVRGRAHLNI